ncbi:MAG: sensor domain-containing diguanylate cyclase [Pseudomonadota bacterium]
MADDKPRQMPPFDPSVLEENLEDLYENAPCGYLSTLPSGLIAKVNETFLKWTGYRREDLLYVKRFQDLLSNGGKIFYETHYFPLLQMQGFINEIAVDFICQDGRKLPAFINSVLKKHETGEPLVIRTTVANATDRRRYEGELLLAQKKSEHLANHDSLTGLMNRKRFTERLHESIADAHRNKAQVAVLLLDLDRFKNINDTLGHHIGDLLLKEVANRLGPCVRESDTVARLGGDEFVVIQTHIRTPNSVQILAEKILKELSRPYLLQGHEIISGCSIGGATYSQGANEIDKLLQNADAAMYRAKSLGSNNYQIFSNPSLTESTVRQPTKTVCYAPMSTKNSNLFTYRKST